MRDQVPGPAPGPLTALSRLLRGAGPPSLSHLMAMFGKAEGYQEFTRLVREFLPDLEPSAGGGLGLAVMDGVPAFARAFRERYFPLEPVENGELESLADMVRWVPIHVQGLDYDDYHDFTSFRPGFVLASLLVDFEREMGLDGDGIRITLLEEAARRVSRELLRRIPQEGYPRGFLEEALAGTPYQGAIAHARYLCHDTGSFFLDATYEEVCVDPPEWDRETVDTLTEHWRRAQDIMDETNIFVDWLEETPEAHLPEVLDFLERRWRGKHRERCPEPAEGRG